jgi:hypothetical protein
MPTDPGRVCRFSTQGVLSFLAARPDTNGSQATWGFYLHQTEDGVTRLIERGRHAAGKGILAKLEMDPI